MTHHPEYTEAIIDPGMPIIDAHHHLWHRNVPDAVTAQAKSGDSLLSSVMAMMESNDPFAEVLRRSARYLLEELLEDINTGHNVIATVFSDAHAMYRTKGPAAMRSVGEVEFVNGVAAMAASGVYGDVLACAGIVSNADLNLGDAVEEVLHAHIHAGGNRYRGVRNHTAYDSDTTLLGAGAGTRPHILLDKHFRRGFQCLQKLGLSYDAWMFEPQLPDLIDLAYSFPDTQIILDHVGTPVGAGQYAGKREERFSIWRDKIRALAKCENVAVKLGGLGMPICGFNSFTSLTPVTSEELAQEWKPYILTCIESFGAERCMFESNFPVDSGTCKYPVLWNAFKRLTSGASTEEKTSLFSGTATNIYRLDI